ncbi:ShlB/FhaC/HecB family hemolysin secretion/activation protein [Sphingomonas hengshuiensis]|uniref:Peptide transporter n=1 Tax=Sphingomonas hengshuiensis TaxID=1609977 RepID=A0A7U5CUZ8_9SPHN|nr:ShlB/FhaC/HecB family hemolysin secretion/activation protein [Sphingomonas hengshuiensis]AJP74254.1 peptide transporter [Sphingomonas hengshuiensis]
MLKSRYLALAVFLPMVAHAQQRPSAGTQLQQLPQPPAPPKSPPILDVGKLAAQPDSAPAGQSVRVTALHITGNTAFAETDLRGATGFAAGTDLTLPELRGFAARIADYYHRRGFILAQAYLPAQDVQDGAVTIEIIEGRYGSIQLRNEARIADRVPNAVLRGLSPGALVTNAPLERRLLLLSDIPGIRTRATLSPGTAAGTSDLIVDVTPGPLISGTVEADNGGSRYTGIYRFGGSINLNNPFGIGDQLGVRLLASDAGLAYGRAFYQAPVGNLTLGVSYAHLRYSLGREFEALDGTGTADIVSAYGRYPVIRSRRANLYALAAIDYKVLRDRIRVVSTDSNKHIGEVTLGLAGDWRDDWAGGGSTVYSLGWTIGTLDIRSAPERAIDASTARSAGTFNKLQSSVARLQSVVGPFSLYAAARAQIAFDNLDSSEKMELGGAYGVRAYPEGEAFGDSGYIATIEARLQLGGDSNRLPGQFELAAFIDTGEVRYAQDPWFTGSNHARRSGYGAGINWAGPQGLLIRTSYARKLGTGPATSAPDKDGRFWFQVVKQF